MAEKTNEAERYSAEEVEETFEKKQKKNIFDLCKNNVWTGIETTDEITIEKVGTPLTNYVYKCTLTHQRDSKQEPNPVLGRIYGEMAKNESFRTKNLLVFNTLAERKLGPTCFGYNNEGRIEEWYRSEHLRSIDLECTLITDLLAIKVAEIHAQVMPLRKKPTFLDDFCNLKIAGIERWLEHQKDTSDDIINNIKAFNLREKLTRVIKAIEDLKPDVVFSHNGLTAGDILYLTESELTDPLDKLVVIDYEYCAYNYRGYDLGMLFIECCIDYRGTSTSSYPGCVFNRHYPSKEKRQQFLREYLKATTGHYPAEGELKQLFDETEACALAVHIMWAIWGVDQSINEKNIHFEYLEYANDHLSAYKDKAKLVFPQDESMFK